MPVIHGGTYPTQTATASPAGISTRYEHLPHHGLQALKRRRHSTEDRPNVVGSRPAVLVLSGVDGTQGRQGCRPLNL